LSAKVKLREQGQSVDENLLAHLSPLGWEHINLTGDYVWHSNKRVAKGRFRPVRGQHWLVLDKILGKHHGN
jgi:hypothetical protein